jgi:Family of unknown function (DUF6172)
MLLHGFIMHACICPTGLTMKKTYPLLTEGKNPDRLLEATKHDIRKYIKRCRGVSLPKGVDFWDFDCKVGADVASAAPVHLAELIAQLDAVAKTGAASAYVEVLAKDGHRVYVHPSITEREAAEAAAKAAG